MADVIDRTTDLTSDVYGINLYINEIKKRFTPEVTEDTLQLGIFGYLGQVFSDTVQNTVVMASEFSNESIPTKAKFEKNIIAHALGLGITDINAIPATFDVLLTFVEDDISNWWTKGKNNGEETAWEFTFDKETPIYIGDFEFHTDYDILIKKIKLVNSGQKNKFSYTAKYLIDVDNPVSDVTNPYLTSPVRMNVNGTNVIFTKCTLRQVEKQTIHKKVLSDNSIASKTVTFEYEGQLAAFTIDVTEGSTTTHLIPVYEGLNIESRKYPYFYYSYLDSNTIRIKFDRSSYAPRINSDVQINLQTTQGESGNFTYDPTTYPGFAAESEKYGYSNIACEVRPITGESANGTDKKSIEDLKKLIPKEALSRGSITNLSDLENFFNMLNTDNSILYFYKKRDNALERLYHSFIIMKDSYNVIIPTNTIDIVVEKGEIDESMKQVVKKGQCFRLADGGKGVIHIAGDVNGDGVVDQEDVTLLQQYISDPDIDIDLVAADVDNDGKVTMKDIVLLSRYVDGEDVKLENSDYGNNFTYVIPYNFIINTSPLYGMYLLTTIDTNKFLDFSYINEECVYQYIATSINWFRGYKNNPNTYELSINMEQNIDDEYKQDANQGDAYTLRCIAVFYDEEDNPLRWAEAELVSRDFEANIFSFKFNFDTEDYIDIDNKIRITTGLYDIGSTNESFAHLTANTKCVIHTVSKQDDSYGLNDLDKIVPNLEGYSLSNSYTVVGGIDFFYDYSDVVNSTVSVSKDEETGKETFTIKNVPVVKYDYFNDEGKAIDFCKELTQRKSYIDYAIQVLEDAFGMDFKFFNTYGPSKLFTIDNGSTYLNRTNLSLTFKLKLRANYDVNVTNDIIADIKDYIEDINEISTIHMPNLVSTIITKYIESIEYFEFVDMNGYGPSVQHLYSMEMPSEVIVPEFVNVQALSDGTPDITLILM